MKHSPTQPPLLRLIAIYIALMLLLALTVFANTLQLGALSLIIALLIAAAKAILVILFFMHVRYASRVTWLFVAAGFLWLTILFSLTFDDYLTRDWLSRADNITQRTSLIPPPPHMTQTSPPAPIHFDPFNQQPH